MTTLSSLGAMRRAGFVSFVLAALLLVPSAAAASTIRIVDVSDTVTFNGAKTDTSLRVGDTIVLELWVNATDTWVNGLQIHADYDQAVLSLLESADASDSFFGAAGTNSDEDHTTFGDVLSNQGTGDTILYAALTNDSQTMSDTRVVRFTFQALAKTDPNTTVIGFKFSPETTAVTAANTSAQDVLSAVDSGVLLVRAALDTHVLITTVSPAGTEFFVIYNPSDDTVDLSRYFVADDSAYYQITTNPTPMPSGDFVFRFPDGATIGVGETRVVAISSTSFHAAYPGVKIDYEFDQDGTADGVADMADSHSPGTTALTDGGEVLVLFRWDFSSDLVQDVDIVRWGTGIVPNKSGVVRGVSTYKLDSATMTALGAPTTAQVLRRTAWDTEGAEARSGSNGLLGHDETSENVGTTWSVSGDTRVWHRMLVAYKRGDVPAAIAEANETGVEGLTLFLRGRNGVADTLTQLDVRSLGTADTANIDTVSLWVDVNSDSTINAGDSLVADLIPTGARSWRFTGSHALPALGETLLLGFAVDTPVENGETVQFRIDSYAIFASISDSASFAPITNANTVTLVSGVLKVEKIIDVAASNILPGDTNVLVMVVRIKGVGLDTLTNVALDNLGNLDDTDLAVEFWRDNGDLSWGAGDTFIGSLQWETAAGYWTLNGLSQRLASGGDTFLFTIGVAATATFEGDTFQAQVPASSCDAVSAETGPPLAVSNTALKTLANPAGTANHIVIAAVYFDDAGASDGDGEWVLLYNPTDTPTNVQNWTLRDAGAVEATLPDSTIPAGGWFLVADGAYNTAKDRAAWPNADLLDTMALNNGDEGLSLVDSTGVTLDRFGVGNAGSDSEGATPPNPGTNAGQIYVRKAHALSDTVDVLQGGRDEFGGAGRDSFNNSADFIRLAGADSAWWTLRSFSSAAETPGRKTTVVKIFDTAPSANVLNAETNATAAVLYIQGETTAAGSLVAFRVDATDTIPLETNVKAVEVWRDGDGNARWSAADTLVAVCTKVAGAAAWETSGIAAAFNALAGETFIVTIDAGDTVENGETVQFRVGLRYVKENGAESGPTVVRTVGTVLTLLQLDPLQVLKGPNLAADTVGRGETGITVMRFRVVGAASDTLTSFALANRGTMDSADVSSLSLWLDDGDSIWDSGDTLAAVLTWDAVDARWETSGIAVGIGAGADFVVRMDVSASATNLDTFLARVPANGVTAAVKDTGPTSSVDEPGTFTVSAYESVRMRLNEVLVNGADLVEIRMVDDGAGGAGVDVSGWKISALDGATEEKVLGDTNNDEVVDSGVIVRTGEYVLLRFTNGVDEFSAGGDGRVDAYDTEWGGLTATDEEVALIDPNGQYRDAVLWSNRDGSPSAAEVTDWQTLITAGAWTGTAAQGGVVNPRSGTAFGATEAFGRAQGGADNDSRLDWSSGDSTPGAANTFEDPITVPADVVATNLVDVPDDLGGSLRASWTPNTGVADFLEYRLYLETAPIDPGLETGNVIPRATSTDSSLSTYDFSGLTNGQNYWFAVTLADSWGHEDRILSDTGPAQPANNITETPAILITEVFAQASGGADTDYIELYVADDGNPTGGLNLAGWTLAWHSGGSRSLAGITVSAGNYMVVDFSQAADTAEADSGADNVVTIAENHAGITSTDAYVSLKDPTGRLVSFVFLANRDGTNPAAAVLTAVREAIDSGVWVGDTVENAAVTPASTAGWNSTDVVALAFVDSRVVPGRDSWTVTSTRTKGAANAGIESPATVPAPPTVTDFSDVPDDLGGALRVTWTPDTSQADFLRYAIYLSTAPIAPRLDTSVLRPWTTVTDSSVGTATLTGLTDSQNYWVAVTIVDTWGHERRSVNADTGPDSPVRNVTGTPVLRFDEVRFAAGSTDVIEIFVVDDGNPTGNLNVVGYKIAQDDTVTPEWTFGAVTVATGDYILVRSEAGTSESDSGGDGVVQQYNATFALPETDEGLFLIEPGGDTIADFVFWSGRDGSLISTEATEVAYAISRGAWTGGAFQGNARTPMRLSDFDDSWSITRSTTHDDSNAYTDWAIDSTPTLGAASDLPEDPFQAPAPVTNVTAVDNPSDFGGAILVTWDPSPASDFHHYKIYVETRPITDLQAADSDPQDTIVPASDTDYLVTSANGAPLVNGETYWIAITAVDVYGNETRLVTSDSAVPQANVSGESLLITEVSYRENATTGILGHDWIEIRCETDGTGGAGLNLSNWRLETRDGTLTFGAVTVNAGGFVLVHAATGTDESDSAAGNNDGIVDIYGLAALTGTDNHAILYRSDRDTEDFVVWYDTAPITDDTGVLQAAITAGRWVDVAPAGPGTEDAVDNTLVGTNHSIARLTVTTDFDSKADWTVDTTPTPGETNGAISRWRIYGTADMETRANDSGVTVQVGDGANTTTVQTDSAGAYSVRVRNGTYTVIADTTYHLRRVVTGVSVLDASSQQATITMRAGDANSDERIDVFDAAVVKYAIDRATGNPAADHVDAVGVIDAADLSAVRGNFGRRGD